VGFAQAGGLDKILGIGGLGRAEEGNFVAAATPPLRPPAGRKGVEVGFYGKVCRPCLSGVWGWAGAVALCAMAHISKSRYGSPASKDLAGTMHEGLTLPVLLAIQRHRNASVGRYYVRREEFDAYFVTGPNCPRISRCAESYGSAIACACNVGPERNWASVDKHL
jgi:hypothetical protein